MFKRKNHDLSEISRSFCMFSCSKKTIIQKLPHLLSIVSIEVKKRLRIIILGGRYDYSHKKTKGHITTFA